MNPILFLFAKNTDANASVRGYNYQTLKTLETWISNFLNKVDEEIYCDFEEDIFQKNQSTQAIKFRQLKLYSSNFSFSSEEIEQTIVHFFMLNLKTDYQDRDKEFVFEASSKIARNYGNNDAELLRRWVEQQQELPEELLKECCSKLKSIVTTYINNEVQNISSKIDKTLVEEAVSSFATITEEDWLDFTRRIRWRFLNKEADEAFSLTIADVENLILALPFPINDNTEAVFGILYKEVSLKASNDHPEQRKLTNSELERLLLKAGTHDDKWYSEVFEKWKDIAEVDDFRIGEFYEILKAVRYCRRHNYLTSHDNFWLNLLESYIYRISIKYEFRKNAVYEYLWLKFRPDDISKLPDGNLLGCEELIREYFKNFQTFHNASDLEDAQSLLKITCTAVLAEKSQITLKELISWFKELYLTLNRRLVTQTNPNERCHLLEELGTLSLFFAQRKTGLRNPSSILRYYEQILDIIDTADFYHATTLSDRINRYLDMLTKFRPKENAGILRELEAFSEKLDKFVEKRYGEKVSAQKQVERAVKLIHSDDPSLLLKALNYLHKAKDLWYTDETIENYVLVLINITQLYNAIGMNIAAKYYSLCAFWICVNGNNSNLYKRIPDAIGMIFHSDFKQGAWLNAITDFCLYFNTNDEFKPTPLDFEKDELLIKSLADFAILLFATPKISSQFHGLIQSQVEPLKEWSEGNIEYLLESLEKDFSNEALLNDLIERKLSDYPLNDVGKTRSVCFYALGSLWSIDFSNDYRTNAIAEEFIAILQILLAEISLSELDFHFVRSTIKLHLIVTTEEIVPPEQLPSNDTFEWNVFVRYFEGKESSEINFHTIKNAISLQVILEEISLLTNEEFLHLFEVLFKEKNLSTKTLSVNAYQKIYRLMINDKRFESVQRIAFLPVSSALNFPIENSIMQWKRDLSSKYNYPYLLECIRNRYKGCNRCLHLTLDELIKQNDFRTYINELRQQGWLDWQILLAMMNFVLNYKANLEIQSLEFATEEDHVDAFKKAFHKYLNQDENEFYVLFPLEAFQTDDFKMHLERYPIYVLESLGLVNNAHFPNLPAVKELLNLRFNIANDNTDEGNPLIEIGRN